MTAKHEILELLVDLTRVREKLSEMMNDGKGKDANAPLFSRIGVQIETLKVVLEILRRHE